MSDLISRQDAIRWVKTECNPYGKPTLDFESGKKVIEHLGQMPSAEPKTGWIPVSERLPEGDELVLVTVLGHVRIWRMGISKVDVTAWMPLPEPYREDREA